MSNIRFAVSERETLKSGYHNKTLFSDYTLFKLSTETAFIKGRIMKINYDSRNYRKHSDKNKNLINKSLKECGAGRSIVIDNEDNIIAGNGIYEQAQKLGLKTKVIETDGSELVVVKRTDLATNDEKRKQLAVMDNSTSDSSEFDFELLEEDFQTETLQDWGLDFDLQISDEEQPQEVSFTVNKKLLKCPCCGHVNEEKAFKNYEDTD